MAKKLRWRPRNGLRLSAIDKRPGASDISARKWLGRIPRVFLHPVLGLGVGALITLSGRGELQLRSVGLLLVALWLAVDLWAWLIKKEWSFRFALGWTSTSLLLVGVMGIMWWWLDGKLPDQREEVAHSLVFAHHYPPGKQLNPIETLFTVTNNSGFAVSGKRQLICYLISAAGNDETSVTQNMWEAFVPDPITRKWEGVFGGGNPLSLWPEIKLGPILEPNGDTDTYDQCLGLTHFETTTNCIDLKLIFLYSLETQPDLMQRKDERLVGTVEGGQFVWEAEPVNSRVDFCRAYYPKNKYIKPPDIPW